MSLAWPVMIFGSLIGGWTAMRFARAYVDPVPPWFMGFCIAGNIILGSCAILLLPHGLPQLFGALLGWHLLLLALIDGLALRLPNPLTLALTVVGLLAAAQGATDNWWLDHGLGAVLGYGLLAGLAFCYRRWRQRDGLGLGDAKLAAAGGAWLGAGDLPLVLLVSSLLGIACFAVMAVASGRQALRQPLPFGLCLAATIWSIWMVEQSLLLS